MIIPATIALAVSILFAASNIKSALAHRPINKYIRNGLPTCVQTNNGIAWSSHNSLFPFEMLSKIDGIKNVETEDRTTTIDLKSGAQISIQIASSLPCHNHAELLVLLPVPADVPAEIRSKAHWKLVGQEDATIVRDVQLVFNDNGKERAIAGGAILFLWENTRKGAGIVIVGNPDYAALAASLKSPEKAAQILSAADDAAKIAINLARKDAGIARQFVSR